jgi:hypothetical protein
MTEHMSRERLEAIKAYCKSFETGTPWPEAGQIFTSLALRDLPALAAAYEQALQRLEGLKVAVWCILGPAHAAMGHPLTFAQKRCEHGTTPFYPTHALWCDECWAYLLAEVGRAADIVREYEGEA